MKERFDVYLLSLIVLTIVFAIEIHNFNRSERYVQRRMTMSGTDCSESDRKGKAGFNGWGDETLLQAKYPNSALYYLQNRMSLFCRNNQYVFQCIILIIS